MKLNQLKYFTAVVEYGGFVSAARELNIAQPALSRQVKELEKELGVQLLDRDRQGSTINESGERFYNRARAILEQLEMAREEVRTQTSKPTGHVRVALPITSAALLAPKLLRKVSESYPLVTLEIVDGLGYEAGHVVESGRVDFGVVPNAEKLDKAEFTPIMEEYLYAVTRREGSKALVSPMSLAQVEKLSLVMPPRNVNIRQIVEEAVSRSGRTLYLRYEQQSLVTILSLVKSGIASSILNWPAVAELWNAGVVDARRIVRPSLSRIISIAVPWHRPLSSAARAVYKVVQDQLVEEVEAGNWHARMVDSGTG